MGLPAAEKEAVDVSRCSASLISLEKCFGSLTPVLAQCRGHCPKEAFLGKVPLGCTGGARQRLAHQQECLVGEATNILLALGEVQQL